MNPKKKNKTELNNELDSLAIARICANDPFFVKKHEQAQKNIDKYGIPEVLLKPRK
jgi:hypothetical protein